MAFPYSSQADQPQGFTDITIDGVTYVVNGISSAPISENRIISRTDGKGRRSDFLIEVGSDQMIIVMELQKATLATPAPLDGVECSYKYDQGLNTRTLVTLDNSINRSQTEMTTFTQRFVYIPNPVAPTYARLTINLTVSGTISDNSSLTWTLPPNSNAQDVEIYSNSAFEVPNTADTGIDLAGPLPPYTFEANLISQTFPPGETWPTIAVRYVNDQGRRSDFKFINFTMPTVSGVYNFT